MFRLRGVGAGSTRGTGSSIPSGGIDHSRRFGHENGRRPDDPIAHVAVAGCCHVGRRVHGRAHTHCGNRDEPVSGGRGRRSASSSRNALLGDRDGRQPRSRQGVPRARRARPRRSRCGPSRSPRRRRHGAPVRSQLARHRLSVSDRGNCPRGGQRQRSAGHPHLESGRLGLASATTSLRAANLSGQRRCGAAGQDPPNATWASSRRNRLIRIAPSPGTALVQHDLAKVTVASSNTVIRPKERAPYRAQAENLSAGQ